jgi:hypothetical protein
MNSIWISTLLPIVLPMVTGYLTTGSMQWLKKLSSYVDRLPTFIKPLIVLVISTAITVAAKALGLTIDATSLSGLSSTDIQSVLGALVAIALHNSKKVTTASETANTALDASANAVAATGAPVYGSKTNPPAGKI